FAELAVFDASTQEISGVGFDFEGDEVSLLDSAFVGVMGGGVSIFAAEQIKGVAIDKFHRGCGQADLESIEITEQVAVDVVDAAVGFVCNNKIEKAHIEALKHLHHGWIGAQVNS